MIAPYAVGPMSVTGFTWYQGESDLGGDASLPEQNNNYTCTQTGPPVRPSHGRQSPGALHTLQPNQAGRPAGARRHTRCSHSLTVQP